MQTGQSHPIRLASVPNPRVSIVVPVYNRAAYVEECLASILDQSGVDFEVVVTDDGSTDDSLDRICSIHDPRLTVLALPKNAGACVARNTSAANARAPWLCMFDSDDIMLPETLSPYVSFVSSQPDVFASSCACRIVGSDGHSPWHPEHPPSSGYMTMGQPVQLCRLFRRNIIPNLMSMVRRDVFFAIGGFDPQFRSAEDYDLWLRVAEHGRFTFFPKCCVLYRRHDNTISVKESDSRDQVRQKFARRMIELESHPSRNAHQEWLIRLWKWAEACARGDIMETLRLGMPLLEDPRGPDEIDVFHKMAQACLAIKRPDLALTLIKLLAHRTPPCLDNLFCRQDTIRLLRGGIQIAVQSGDKATAEQLTARWHELFPALDLADPPTTRQASTQTSVANHSSLNHSSLFENQDTAAPSSHRVDASHRPCEQPRQAS